MYKPVLAERLEFCRLRLSETPSFGNMLIKIKVCFVSSANRKLPAQAFYSRE